MLYKCILITSNLIKIWGTGMLFHLSFFLFFPNLNVNNGIEFETLQLSGFPYLDANLQRNCLEAIFSSTFILPVIITA